MMPLFAVVFAGLLGNGNPESTLVSVDVASAIAEKADIEPIRLPREQLAAIVHRTARARETVVALHVDGLIAGELIAQRGALTLRLVVCGPDGGVRSLTEMTLHGHKLTRAELDTIRDNLADEVHALTAQHAAPAVDDAAPRNAPAQPTAPAQRNERDGAAPRNGTAQRDAPAQGSVAGNGSGAPGSVAVATGEGGASGEDGVAAGEGAGGVGEGGGLAGDGGTATGGAAGESAGGPGAGAGGAGGSDGVVGGGEGDALEDEEPHLGLRIGAGLGIVARSFSPGPSTVAGYSASPVSAFDVAAQVRPTRWLAIDASIERTLSMSSMVGAVTASTMVSRWEVSADGTLTRLGPVAVAARLGYGRRAFAIDAGPAGRPPDVDYGYLIAGVAGGASITHRIAARAIVAIEPVIAGAQPTEMAFGDARRWALELGAALELRITDHVFARAAADLQSFQWTWTTAGDRGAGGARDLYPSAMASIGAVH